MYEWCHSSSVDNTLRRCRYWHEIRPTFAHEFSKSWFPVVSGVPGDIAGNLYGNDLTCAWDPALNNDDKGTKATTFSAPLLSPLQLVQESWTTPVKGSIQWDDLSFYEGELKHRFRVGLVVEHNEKCLMSNVRRHALDLEGLHSGPLDELLVLGDKVSKTLRQSGIPVYVVLRDGILAGIGLAHGTVCAPAVSLAFI